MNWLRILLDRTAVLFLGVAAGVAIGYAFGTGNEKKDAVGVVPDTAPVIASHAVAPPPPNGPGGATTEPAKAVVSEAPPSDKPAIDSPSPQLSDTVKSGSQIHVGVFGDSFGDGVYSALYRLLPAKAGYQVTKYSQQSTGFTRYRRLDLEQHDDQQIDGQKLDIAVISFGANDAQGVCDGGHCGALMGKFWQQVIGARVEAYVAMLRRHGATVYWVGLPVMRDPAFDSDARAMDEFYRGLMARLGVPYIDIRPMTVDAQGKYQAYYQDQDGTPKLLRAGDGVHMSMNGYIRVVRGLADRISASVVAARGGQGVTGSIASAAPPPPTPPAGSRAPEVRRSPSVPRRPPQPHAESGVVADIVANISKPASKPSTDAGEDAEQ
jgi:hypothetical protein